MSDNEINFINELLYRMFLPIINDSADTGNIVDSIIDEVVEDVKETADEDNWNSEDVRIALARVIKKKFGVD